jgi:colicin import membrane protein
MKKWIGSALLLACCYGHAQTSSDAERLRISTERSQLEAAGAVEDSACYQRFLVNSCLEEVKVRRRDALADLRRQEIVLNDQARKAKAAEQLQKIQDKLAPEKLQQEADKRAQDVKDYADRMARDRQKTADREALQAGEKAKSEAASARLKSHQDKESARIAKQAAAAEELKKYNQRQEQAKERQARYAKDQASPAKTAAKPLPAAY